MLSWADSQLTTFPPVSVLQNIQSDCSCSGRILSQIFTSVMAPWWDSCHSSRTMFYREIVSQIIVTPHLTLSLSNKWLEESSISSTDRPLMLSP